MSSEPIDAHDPNPLLLSWILLLSLLSLSLFFFLDPTLPNRAIHIFLQGGAAAGPPALTSSQACSDVTSQKLLCPTYWDLVGTSIVSYSVTDNLNNNCCERQHIRSSVISNAEVCGTSVGKCQALHRAIRWWQIHEGLPAFYQKKATVEDRQGNPQERLLTSGSLKNPTEMLPCGKGEQQDSATFETLHLKKGEWRIMPSGGLHRLRTVSGMLTATKDSRPDLLSTWTVGGAEFLDNEMCLLLAAQITSRKMMGIEDTPYGVYLPLGKTAIWTRNSSCLDSLTKYCAGPMGR
ncbi:hypothetical protein STEG23_002269 [Scotinomys teguina]